MNGPHLVRWIACLGLGLALGLIESTTLSAQSSGVAEEITQHTVNVAHARGAASERGRV